MFRLGRISLPPRVWRPAVVAALAFSIGSATVAFGLVVNGVVFACYHNATGVLRLELAEKPCNTTTSQALLRETRISWNQVGPQGLQGIQGLKGDQGIQGIQGVKGDKGETGDQGIQGLKGDQGIQGIQGVKGDKGDQGIQGVPGVQGERGIQGVKGDPGAAGSISGIDALVGTPCKAGSGTLEVSYAEITGAVSLACRPNVMYELRLQVVSPPKVFPCRFPGTPGADPICEWSFGQVQADPLVFGFLGCRILDMPIATCVANVAQGTSVLLTSSVPASWTGACSATATTCTVIMDGDKQVTATLQFD